MSLALLAILLIVAGVVLYLAVHALAGLIVGAVGIVLILIALFAGDRRL